MKRAIHLAVAILSLGTFSGAARAGHENDLVSQAHRIESYADQLKREVNLHFRHTSEYRHLLGDAAAIRREAEHIDSLAHQVRCEADLRHVSADLRDLDRLVHHVGELIGKIEHGHGRGHAHSDTRHVRGLVASINRSTHCMEQTVRAMGSGFRSHHDRGHGGYARYDRRRGPERIAGEIFREILRHR